MPGPARAGALIYALDLERMSGFYRQVLGMRLLHADAEHQVIESDDLQLIVHAIPPPIAATITLASPPVPRDEQALKLFFTVTSLADAALRASALGGALFGPAYAGPGFEVRNGHDPEGNIFQLRELRKPSGVHEQPPAPEPAPAPALSPLPPTPTGRYRHHKGNAYEVIGVVRHSETLEPLVLYRPLGHDTGLWVRPHAMFFETVEVDGRRQPRFAPDDAPAAPPDGGDEVQDSSRR